MDLYGALGGGGGEEFGGLVIACAAATGFEIRLCHGERSSRESVEF